MTCRHRLVDQAGFTLVEVMVAVFILLVGVLGVVSLIDGANFATAKTKSREGGTNLAREILDGARAVDYDKLNRAEVEAELQKQPGLEDSDISTGAWEIERRGITYTVTAESVCKVDDRKDEFGVHPVGEFCTGSSATGTNDPNPDDMRRMDVRITWSVAAATSSVRQTTLIVNPSGSLGPSVKTFCVTGLPAPANTLTCPAMPINLVKYESDTKVSFAATTLSARSFHWQVDDGKSWGEAAPTPIGSSTGWTFTWDLKPVGMHICGTTPDWTLDGNYLVGGQAFDPSGIEGQRSSLTVTVNRSRPFETCGLEGGYNDPSANAQPPTPDRPPRVELQWKANPERDIVGYHVYRRELESQSTDQVCDTTETSCFDPDPPRGRSYDYYVVAVDRDPTGAPRESSTYKTHTIDVPGRNRPPAAPTPVSAPPTDGPPVIKWGASTDPDNDSIRFYRIYRDGTGYANRYDTSGDGATLSYTDNDPGTGRHTYYVSAVDTKFAESVLTGPVTVSVP
jgi:prepilin-type N-terminal cleavage/methylation domain-containing protein